MTMTTDTIAAKRTEPWIPAGHPLFKWTSGSDVQARWRKYGWTPPSERITPPVILDKQPEWVHIVRRVK